MMNMPGVMALARHFYETRREVLAAGGAERTPWCRLSEDERAVAVAEAHIVLEAVRRADEEQVALQILIAAQPPTDASPRRAGV
ncbi:hypothetical protein ACWGJ2_40410 [Streptomyces sp. NPDC054796]